METYEKTQFTNTGTLTKLTLEDEAPEKPTIGRNKSKDTIDIEDARNGKRVVTLLPEGTPQDEDASKPLDITDPQAMEAASIEIKEHICNHGSITATKSAEIIQTKMKILQLLWTHFPGAIKYCGEVFHMGGLAGIPFTGKVGFGAFSHHVPDNGHCAVLLAPHIGIDNQGKLGAYSRDGQSHSGSCCGAAVGAYVYCRAGKAPPSLAVDPELYQFNYIINQVHDHMDDIVGETECAKQASLARYMHKIGTNLLDKCVGTDFGSEQSTLVVLTGIQINMPRPFTDYFLPMEFYILKKDGTKEDVFEEAFGKKN
eukprot:scaffold1143_cov177-Amphora_coffeaeformis.AAC.21